jgi:hypothetical protein
MTLPTRLFFILLLFSLFSMVEPPRLVLASDWPTISGPPGASVEWVGNDLAQNGVSMRIQRIVSADTPAGVAEFYRALWNNGDRPAVENQVGEWLIVGKQQGDYYLTIQVRDNADGGAEGFLGVSTLPRLEKQGRIPGDTRPHFPQPAGSVLLSSTASKDMGKEGQTLIVKNNLSLFANASFYRQQMQTHGWQLRQNRHQEDTSPGFALYFERNYESCHIAIIQDEDGASMIVANLVINKKI